MAGKHGRGEKEPAQQDTQERVATGVQRLDFILKGGLIRTASYVILGPPGTGKTVLGNQICFNHVMRGGRALYVTLLSESHARMLSNIRSMSFFDEEVIPGQLRYLSGYDVLEREGLEGLLAFVRDAARKHRATLLVVDGLDAAGEFAPTTLAFKKYLHEQQAFTSLLGCTTLMLTPRGAAEAHAANTSVDGILELSLQNVGPRGVRELTVHKFRGSDCLLGRHEVEISRDGVVIHPRTEVQFADPHERAREDRIRMAFGIKRLDEALHGGVLSGSATTLLGAPGTGKTLLGLKFLEEGSRAGEPGVYFGFFETPPRLVEKGEAVGIHLARAVKSKLLEIQWQPPLENNLDSLAERLLERIRERDVGKQRLRLFVDGISGFRSATVYPDRLGRFLSALTHQLRILDVTTVFSEETPLFRPDIEMPNQELGGAVENVILLRNVELQSELHRLVSIMKVRESAYDSAIREFRISQKGIEVDGPFPAAEGILSGQARSLAVPAPKRKKRRIFGSRK
ncbi:circadian clock protein KaiC [Aggregicoccus sp. 17bor-14]|uniref:ATPase domain-containing protein n=1 Tax=Myxococcaceae TaxID=31 RepID=UPI00129C1508|nr:MULTISPECIES: ATPase domain-containing protein [Myxococcaceae]MBF5044468.1 circadian clock protein KaiC [Simulacricoccus sp. 17bor-14]MRI90214.1 circadian clock protein KaiC [Aggregicoccus sp. 17bor-14]